MKGRYRFLYIFFLILFLGYQETWCLYIAVQPIYPVWHAHVSECSCVRLSPVFHLRFFFLCYKLITVRNIWFSLRSALADSACLYVSMIIFFTLPGAQIWGSKACNSWNKQFCRFLLSVCSSLDGVWGKYRCVVLLFWRRLRGWALAVKATAKVWWTAAPQGIELPQLIPQKVAQGGSANWAAQVGQQEVTMGARCWREMERVIRAVPGGFHDGGEPGFL